jgi:hypothetical protein
MSHGGALIERTGVYSAHPDTAQDEGRAINRVLGRGSNADAQVAPLARHKGTSQFSHDANAIGIRIVEREFSSAKNMRGLLDAINQ